MPETDIYKKREPMPVGKKPDKKRKRRSSSQRAFDDRDRKRRSKNSGLRRFLHLSRKSKNEKFVWSSVGIFFVLILILIGLWQFVIQEYLVRNEERANNYIEYHPRIPEASDEPLMSGLAPSDEEDESASE